MRGTVISAAAGAAAAGASQIESVATIDELGTAGRLQPPTTQVGLFAEMTAATDITEPATREPPARPPARPQKQQHTVVCVIA